MAKKKDYNSMSLADLEKALKKAVEAFREAKLAKGGEQNRDVSGIRMKRKEIARINTAISKQKNADQNLTATK